MTVWDCFQCIIFVFQQNLFHICLSVMNVFMNVLTSLMSLCCSFPAVKLCVTDCLYSLVLCSTSCTKQSLTHLEVYVCVWLTERERLFVWYVGMQVSVDSEWCTTCKRDRRRGKNSSSSDIWIITHMSFILTEDKCSHQEQTITHSLSHKHINYITRFMTGLFFIFTWCSGTVLFW